MFLRSLLFVLILQFLLMHVEAETPISDSATAEKPREIVDMDEETISESSLQQFFERFEKILNINTATEDELGSIPGMSELPLHSIVEYRKSVGRIYSLSELKNIPGMTPDLFHTLTFCCSTVNENKTSSIKLRSRMIEGFPAENGFLNGSYKGSNYALYNRLQINVTKTVECGIITQRDAGDKDLIDFTSGYIQLRPGRIIQSCIIGDYSIDRGEGVEFFNSSAFRNYSGLHLSWSPQSHLSSPNHSTSPSSFYRGACMDIDLSLIHGFLFYSSKNIDANLDTQGSITSFSENTYHRTDTEISKKWNTQEKVVGGGFDIQTWLGNVGCSGYSSGYNRSFSKGNTLNIDGDRVSAVGISYNLHLVDLDEQKAIHLTGEWMEDQNNTIGGLTLLRFQTNSYVLYGSFRTYPSGFCSIHGNALSDGSMKNEKGARIGLTLQVSSSTSCSFFEDFLVHPDCSSSNPLPEYSRKLYFELTHQLSPDFQTKFLYNHVQSSSVSEFNSDGVRCDMRYRITEKCTMEARGEIKDISDVWDILVFYDLHYQINSLTTDARIVYFRTDDYSTRCSELEDDVPGAWNSQALFGTGIRWYFCLGYSISNSLHTDVKISETVKHGVSSLGTGTDQIMGNKIYGFRFQFDWSL